MVSRHSVSLRAKRYTDLSRRLAPHPGGQLSGMRGAIRRDLRCLQFSPARDEGELAVEEIDTAAARSAFSIIEIKA